MYVCICNAITDRDIRAAARQGAASFADLQASTGCSNCCGNCEETARALFDEALTVSSRPLRAAGFAHAA